MALSGSFQKNITPTGSFILRCDWTATQSIANNTSTITVKVYLVNTGALGMQSRTNNTITINGTSYTFTSSAISTTGTHLLGTATSGAIAHNSDGTKSVSISVSWRFNVTMSSGKYYGTQTLSGTANLTTIPRASSLRASNGTLNTAQTLTITRADSSFKHKITYVCGSVTGYAAGSSDTFTTATSISWTPPLSLAAQNTTGTSVSVTLYLKTYTSSGSLIGQVTKTLTMAIPASVKPSCTLSISDPTGYESAYGGYIQGLSKFSVTVTPTTAQGSAIASYSTSANGSIYTSASFTTDVIKTSGSNTISATVKDKRGRSGSASATKTVLAYSAPFINALSVNRCNSNGTTNEEGEYVLVTFSGTVTSLSNKNTATYVLKYKKTTTTTWTSVTLTDVQNSYSTSGATAIFAAASDSSYDVQLVLTDDFKEATKSTSVSTAFTLIHCSADGTGIAFGKLVESSNLLDCGLGARFTNDVYGTAVGLAGFPTIPENADANTYLTPGCYGLKSNATAKTVTNFPLTGVAGRLFVADSLGATIQTNGWVYRIQTFIPYQTTYPTYVRQVIQTDSSSWTYGSWTPTTMQALSDLFPNQLTANLPSALPAAMLSSISQKRLWSGGWMMGSSHTVTLSEAISKQYNGIVLVWSAYEDSAALDANFNLFYVPKWHVATFPGCGICMPMVRVNYSTAAAKYVYVNDTTITGSDYNSSNGVGTGASGVTYNNKAYVLRRVIGV